MKCRLTLLVAFVLFAGCGPDRELRVGSKAATENQILAEMLALVAQNEGVPVRKLVPYGNTFDCQEGVKAGELDVYPEYTGTGLSMMGVPAQRNADGGWEPDQDLARVKRLFQPFGLRWLGRFGVDNRYVLVVRPGLASRYRIDRISQLANIEGGVRVGTGTEFQNRVIDGMPALIRRYGLTDVETPLITDDKKKLYDALLKQSIDVAVGYGTDGRIEEFGLKLLNDDLRLFPPYEVAPLIRAKALEVFPALEGAFAELAGVLDAATMRRLNKQVELAGAAPSEVARGFLIAKKLIVEPAAKRPRKKLWVAIPPGEDSKRFSRLHGLALAALRSANPGRAAESRASADPVDAVVSGEAFAAVIGAEHFFQTGGAELPRANPEIEAACPVGFRMLHVLARRGAHPALAQVTKLGVGSKGGSTHRIAQLLVEAYGVSNQVELVFGELEEQLAAVKTGALDARLEHVEVGAPQVTRALRDAAFSLAPIDNWEQDGREFRHPFMRRSRIPARAYPRMVAGVDTVSTQVVIAGPARVSKAFGDHGPVDVIASTREPLPRALKQRLVEAISGPRMIDPSLPGESVGVGRKVGKAAPINPTPEVSLLTALLLFLFVYVFVEVFRTREEKPAPEEKPPAA